MLIRHHRKKKKKAERAFRTTFEAQDSSLVFIPKLLRPLCLSRLCHIDTFFDTTRYRRPEETTAFLFFFPFRPDYLRLFVSFPFASVSVLPPNLKKKAAFKRQTVKKRKEKNPQRIANPLFKNGSELEMSKWSLPSKKKKIFYWGSEMDLEQSTVYVTYLIQESRSLDKPCFRTSQIHWKKKKMFQATNQTFVLIFIYIVWR